MGALTEKIKVKKEKMQSGVWHPAEGDVLEGTVIEIGETVTANGDAKFCKIEPAEGGDVVMVFLNSVLQKQFDEEKVEESDIVAIEFLGEVKSRNGNRTYRNYVAVKAESCE